MNGDFFGLPTERIENQHLTLEFLKEAGPRLVRLSLAGSGKNLLAEVPDRKVETTYGTFWLYGGHRLWHSPEAFSRTYVPDNQGLEIDRFTDGVRLTAPVEKPTGIRKGIEIHLDPGRPALTLHHTLTNEGLWSVELAAWAITQLPLDGWMILPQQQEPLDPDSLLPNRHIVLWPYASWNDPRLQLRDDMIWVHGQALMPPIKVGYFNRLGWIGYLQDEALFVKRFQPQSDQPHVDFGCNAESYCNDLFIEMETLGPLTRLNPGHSIIHTETWEFYPNPHRPKTVEEIQTMLAELSL